jgi:hypothetical protein
VVDEEVDAVELVVTDSHLYWNEFLDGRLERIHLQTAEREGIDTLDRPVSFAVGPSYVYVAQYAEEGEIVRVSLDDWSSEVLYASLDFPGYVILDGDTLYWALSTDDGTSDTAIVAGNTAGDPYVEVRVSAGSVQALRLDGPDLFALRYGLDGNLLERTPVAAPDDTEILATPAWQPIGLALTADRAYWADIAVDGMGNYGRVWSVSRTGGAPTLFVDHDNIIEGLAVVSDDAVVVRFPLGIARLVE